MSVEVKINSYFFFLTSDIQRGFISQLVKVSENLLSDGSKEWYLFFMSQVLG